MTKQEFINILSDRLKHLPTDDRQEIIADYEEHFIVGMENGKTEAEIAKSLGLPSQLARELSAGYHIQQVEQKANPENIFRAIIATGALGFFNLIFILAPAIGIYASLFGFWVSALAFVAAPILLLIVSIFGFQQFFFFEFFASLFMSGIGIFMTIGLFYLSRWVIKITIKYLKFNLRIIEGGK